MELPERFCALEIPVICMFTCVRFWSVAAFHISTMRRLAATQATNSYLDDTIFTTDHELNIEVTLR